MTSAFPVCEDPPGSGTPAQAILEQLEHLLEHPGTHRMPNLLLVGDTNNGKTMLIRRFVELHPAERGVLGSKRRVLLIQAPSSASTI